jgi:hypothetical protein
MRRLVSLKHRPASSNVHVAFSSAAGLLASGFDFLSDGAATTAVASTTGFVLRAEDGDAAAAAAAVTETLGADATAATVIGTGARNQYDAGAGAGAGDTTDPRAGAAAAGVVAAGEGPAAGAAAGTAAARGATDAGGAIGFGADRCRSNQAKYSSDKSAAIRWIVAGACCGICLRHNLDSCCALVQTPRIFGSRPRDHQRNYLDLDCAVRKDISSQNSAADDMRSREGGGRAINMYRFIASLLVVLAPRSSALHQVVQIGSISSNSRRAFFVRATSTIATTAAWGEVANAGIDVSSLKVEQPAVTPGKPPNAPPSGPLAGTPLGYKVGGGPRSEEEVRKIDEPRYAAVRKAQGLPPLFLDGVPVEKQTVPMK